MPKLNQDDLDRLQTLSKLACCNPFFPERIELERQALGSAFVDDSRVAWSFRGHRGGDLTQASDRHNVVQLSQLANELIERFCESLQQGDTYSQQQWQHYWDGVNYVLLYRHLVHADLEDFFQPNATAKLWKAFAADYARLAHVAGIEQIEIQTAPHLFACLCQVRRAFYNIYLFILGESFPSVELRGAVWQSIFTTDLRRYRRRLFDRMSELPTLITGPSGTGKELVARAIGLSQYIPFDEKKASFTETNRSNFFPLNLSAMSASLIESELFGHRKGAFTGAIADRQGWLEQCCRHGAVFLDEIGELDPSLQVKLLRVVQQRTYSRLGESTERVFAGKIIGATNREMDVEIEAGRFREDLYYRLCADRIQTPSLRHQLNDRPEDLRTLTYAMSRNLVGEDAEEFSEQASAWILENLGSDYPWRGNIRELEQCASSLLIRGTYVPTRGPDVISREPSRASWLGRETEARRSVRPSEGRSENQGPPADPGQPSFLALAAAPPWLGQAIRAELSAESLLQCYCDWVYQQSGSYDATAKKLSLDRRTVKAKIDSLHAEKPDAQ